MYKKMASWWSGSFDEPTEVNDNTKVQLCASFHQHRIILLCCRCWDVGPILWLQTTSEHIVIPRFLFQKFLVRFIIPFLSLFHFYCNGESYVS